MTRMWIRNANICVLHGKLAFHAAYSTGIKTFCPILMHADVQLLDHTHSPRRTHTQCIFVLNLNVCQSADFECHGYSQKFPQTSLQLQHHFFPIGRLDYGVQRVHVLEHVAWTILMFSRIRNGFLIHTSSSSSSSSSHYIRCILIQNYRPKIRMVRLSEFLCSHNSSRLELASTL